jgi:uncharacterized protein (TIGR03435 family)
LRFEVVSVKPSRRVLPGSPDTAYLDATPGGRFIATNQALKTLIAVAYNLTVDEIVSAPSWVGDDRWDIEAKAEEGTIPQRGNGPLRNALTPTQVMLQALLQDRFQLVVHKENRAQPGYDLVVSKGGPKFRRSDDQTPPSAPSSPPVIDLVSPPERGRLKILGRETPYGMAPTKTMVGKAVKISAFASFVQSFVDRRPVNDKTGLIGLFDIEVRFSWEPSGLPSDVVAQDEDPSAPSIFIALQEQLGLSLQSAAKAPKLVLVIDRVQRPSAN